MAKMDPMRMDFGYLFDPASVTTDRKIGETYVETGPVEFEETTGNGRKRKVRHRVTGFITMSDGRSFYAKPGPGVVNMVVNRLLALDRDSIYFKAVRHADGIALYGQNNLILNSGPPLCNIDPETWPEFPDEES